MSNDELFQRQVDDLFHALEKDDLSGSLGLIGAIGDAKNTAAVEPLVILLEFPDERVRYQAVVALGKLDMLRSVQTLIKALGDPSPAVREGAVIALGNIGDPRAAGPLENLSLDTPGLAKAVEESLLQIESKNRKDALFKMIGGKDKTSTAGRPPQFAVPDGGQPRSPPAAVPEPIKPEPVPVAVKPAAPAPAEPKVAPATVRVASPRPEKKSPVAAAIASFFIPGLGQLYNGEKLSRALIFLGGFLIGTILLFIPGLIVWLYGIYNAYTTANLINAGKKAYKENNAGLMAVFAVGAVVITAIVLVIVTIVAAAFIAAFVFQIGSDTPQGSFKQIGFSVSPTDPNSVTVTNIGGADTASLKAVQVLVDGKATPASSGAVTSKVGSSATYPVSQGAFINVIAEFTDGNSQAVWSGTFP